MKKVSIITASFNSDKTIESTIQSVIAQKYPNIEYIIIDGGSTDNTSNILNKYKGKISKIVSEKDNGIYDAFNKGLKYASGDIIGFLNSDDFFANEYVIETIVNTLVERKADAVYSDLQYVDKDNTDKIKRYWDAGYYKRENFLKGWMPPHPTFYTYKKYYDEFGGFNTQLKTSADYELMLRFLYKHKLRAIHIPEVMIKMRIGGKSNKSIKNRIEANLEDRMAWKLNHLKPGRFTFVQKPLSKITQFFKK